MKTLLLQLPLGQPGPQAVYGLAWLDAAEPEARLQRSHAPLALLPHTDRRAEVVVMVPAQAQSWHRVTLPPGLSRAPARLQAALYGLLEDRLLQEPQHVQLALAPGWRAGESTWVAACDQSWLLAHLEALESAGLAVQRIVPEMAPPAQAEVWHALGDADSGWLWCRSAEHGVCGWPIAVSAAWPASWAEGAPLLAEPGLSGWAQARAGSAARLVDPASHWREALNSGWNLAQFALQSRLRSGRWQGLRRLADGLVRQPQWRAARWGLLAFLLVQLAGLQAWAWMTGQRWQAQQAQWTAILQESFPQVKVVIDAPVQMAREVDRLRQGSGELAPQDMETLLQALGESLPAGVPAPRQLSYQNGQLHWPAPALGPVQTAALVQALESRGYRLSTEGPRWRLQARENRP